MFKTESELIDKLICYLPGLELGEDNEGQIIIYTGLYQTTERDEKDQIVLQETPSDKFIDGLEFWSRNLPNIER